jgi:hypothetical protein
MSQTCDSPSDKNFGFSGAEAGAVSCGAAAEEEAVGVVVEKRRRAGVGASRVRESNGGDRAEAADSARLCVV